jgi:phosphoribosylformylglycinamidine synthase
MSNKSNFKLGVRIMPRTEVLDTQGRAVQMTVSNIGYAVTECRVGRYVILDLQAQNQKEAELQAQKISEDVLCNMLIETYKIENVEGRA